MEKTITKENLATVLEGMAGYVRSIDDCEDELSAYFSEITETGLFSDSEGDVVEAGDGYVKVRTDY